MTLKEIIGNGQLKRIGPTIERFEAVTTTVPTLAISTQQVTATPAIRPIASTSIRLAPHFTCSAESCYEFKKADKLRIKKERVKLTV